MNYIVFDLEFNQKHPDKKNNDFVENPLVFEILQIGALKLNRNLKPMDTFNQYIKPNIHLELHPYVETLTNISMEKLDGSNLFPIIFESFIKFIGDEDSVLVTWGINDIKEFFRNAIHYNLDINKIPKKYIDIQNYASKLFKCAKGTKLGLKTAIEELDIEMDVDFHDAFNDALYTAKIFNLIYSSKIKVIDYSYDISKRISSPKTTLDQDKLFSQFKKMYKRDLSAEEKEMLKIAYNMGKTNQFSK